MSQRRRLALASCDGIVKFLRNYCHINRIILKRHFSLNVTNVDKIVDLLIHKIEYIYFPKK